MEVLIGDKSAVPFPVISGLIRPSSVGPWLLEELIFKDNSSPVELIQGSCALATTKLFFEFFSPVNLSYPSYDASGYEKLPSLPADTTCK